MKQDKDEETRQRQRDKIETRYDNHKTIIRQDKNKIRPARPRQDKTSADLEKGPNRKRAVVIGVASTLTHTETIQDELKTKTRPSNKRQGSTKQDTETRPHVASKDGAFRPCSAMKL